MELDIRRSNISCHLTAVVLFFQCAGPEEDPVRVEMLSRHAFCLLIFDHFMLNSRHFTLHWICGHFLFLHVVTTIVADRMDGGWTEVRYGRGRQNFGRQRRVQFGEGSSGWKDRAPPVSSRRGWDHFPNPNPNPNTLKP